MSPEQELDASVVDHRADLYSLGVMFYEMLAGRPPSMMAAAAVPGQEAFVEAVAGRAAPPRVRLTNLRADLFPEIDDFVERALAKNPDDRVSSAAEFREELLKLYTISCEREAAAAALAAEEQAKAEALASLGLWGRAKARFRRIFRRE
jgi:serine/threonine-protein kinase